MVFRNFTGDLPYVVALIQMSKFVIAGHCL